MSGPAQHATLDDCDAAKATIKAAAAWVAAWVASDVAKAAANTATNASWGAYLAAAPVTPSSKPQIPPALLDKTSALTEVENES